MSIGFWVSGRPVAAARPRVTRHGTYTPLSTRRWKERVWLVGEEAMGRMAPFKGPVRAVLQFYFTPLAKLRKAEAAALLGAWRTLKPDGDNLAKAVLDALNGVCFVDDAQVVDLSVTKRFGAKAGVRVYIEEFE